MSTNDHELPGVWRIDPQDDVATALRPLSAGEKVKVGGTQITVAADIAKGHKLALHTIAAGAPVRKYGWPIGIATAAIGPGEHVHSHNVKTGLDAELSYQYQPNPLSPVAAGDLPAFQGYRRADGRVGTRNEIWVLCTVGCVANTARLIAEEGNRRFAGRVDGVHAFPHPFGCSQLGDDLDHTRSILAALAQHPNAGGVLLVGLGCESNQLDRLLQDMPSRDATRLRAFAAQKVGDELEEGLAAVEELVAIAEGDHREACPLSDLVLGLKCGGSDGFSGLTANPLLGQVTDRLTAGGGTAVLTEIPEIFGAEELLMRRAASRQVFDDLVGVVNGFKRYFLDHNQPVHENPSPGNKAGGITTLEEKSLGAVQKGGRATVTQVMPYGGRVNGPGLALLEAPGNDAVSCTALVASGATLLLFTTGRGTPLGFPVPTLKIATNSDLASRKPRWIDFDAGTVLGAGGMEEATDRLLDLIAVTASGVPARNETNGEREIALWKSGVTL
jgi:altronate hydrolase